MNVEESSLPLQSKKNNEKCFSKESLKNVTYPLDSGVFADNWSTLVSTWFGMTLFNQQNKNLCFLYTY